MIKKNTILLFLVSILFVTNLFAQRTDKKTNQIKPLKIFVAGINVGNGLEELNPSKIEAAFAFAMLMSNYFDIIPQKDIDTISNRWRQEGKQVNIKNLAEYFKADFLIYLNFNRFKNMLRCDATLLSDKDYKKQSKGEGYSYLNYIDTVKKEYLYDPSILTSIQRAFAASVKDSNLYSHLKNPIFPAKTLVISGIEFIKQPSSPNWKIFNNEVINSFYIIEKLFESASKSTKYQPFDVETRDSIYATFKLYAPENYKAPNQMELYTLRKYEVQSFLTGSFEQIGDSAKLTLVINEFNSMGIVEIKRAEGVLAKDSMQELDTLLEALGKELFDITEQISYD
jgi:hypothetical protein